MFPTLTPVTKNIIVINVIFYLVSFFFPFLYFYLSAFFPFSPNFHWWQIITHMFMHDSVYGNIGIFHILFNMLTLASFGPILEKIFGNRRFVLLYFLSGIGAFLLFSIAEYVQFYKLYQSISEAGVNANAVIYHSNLSFSKLNMSFTNNSVRNDALNIFQMMRTPMMGASGAISGLVACFATLFPNVPLTLMFIPIPIKAKYLVGIFVIVSIYFGIFGLAGNVAHFAHVGGAIVGFLLAKYWKKNQYRIN